MSLERTYKTEGLVIKRFNFGEADKILTIFTKHYGKIKCLAKGIRKLTSRKAAALELFNWAVIFVVKGKNLDLVTEAQTVNTFSNFKKKLPRVALAYKLCELTDRLSAENQANQLIFFLLRDNLVLLDKPVVDLGKLETEFKRQLLEDSGFGLPKNQDSQALDDYLEQIMEKKINSSSLLKSLTENQ